MHKARSSQLLPHPKHTEETHEVLSVVQVLTSSTELACNDSEKKTIVMFSCKNNLEFFKLH